ncbi:type III PLP-dependent enzyme [Streptomyces violaceusniger]|uniref:Orn/DAP/Arg decarboxylase 2 n=1 Tax=Streptomyces violaceusniger (strain Tu 4113) TaxID=653045 RepID=G2NVT6_STRV4|nr:type III PLP-dependent enzyme [Streptomyces violaceusniger]AEM86177.1 Orn/DAP/Arg decarboxylase 2 [Streptomyces violaceusniger Tu 4113]
MITPAVRTLATELTGDDLPAYVYDLTALRAHARAVRDALPPGLELYYAAKANPAPAVLQALASHITGYEVASGGEVEHVRAAVPGAPLAFGGPGKTEGELRRALTLGVERFHVESEQELRLLAGAAEDAGIPDVDVLLRVNLPVAGDELGGAALAMGGRPSPFGLDPEAVERCLPLFAEASPGGGPLRLSGGGGPLRLRGIHAHLASGLDAPAQVAVAAAIADWAAKLSERHGLGLTEVNVGGGMGVDYAHPDRRFDWAAYGQGMADLALRHPGLTLRIEPGRALTVYCGWYVTEVLDIKHSGGEAFAVVRGGTHHLRTPATKQHDQPFQVLPMDAGDAGDAGDTGDTGDTWTRPWARPAVRAEPVTLVGQLCTPKDVLASRVPVAEVRVGDRVAFAMAGAYAWNISHHDFLMHPRPGFHYLEE